VGRRHTTMFDDDLMFDQDLDTEGYEDEDTEIEDVFLGNDADDAWEWATDDDLSFI
jgi:hypothetical protein